MLIIVTSSPFRGPADYRQGIVFAGVQGVLKRRDEKREHQFVRFCDPGFSQPVALRTG